MQYYMASDQGVMIMLSNISTELSVDYAEVYIANYNNTPSKSLLFAILERAISDLFIPDRNLTKHKTDAMRWFLSPSKSTNTSFSFPDVIQHLNISSRTTQKLMALAWSMQCKRGKYYELYTKYRSRYNRGVCDLDA